MEYLIYNFTDIGIKDIQLKYIENIVEKSIYGIYCLVLYLIQKISKSKKNKSKPEIIYADAALAAKLRHSQRSSGGFWSNGLYVPTLKEEFELRKNTSCIKYNRIFTMVCGGHAACLGGAILYYIYIRYNFELNKYYELINI